MADAISLVARPILSEIIRNVSSLISGEYSLIHGVKEDLEKVSSHLKSIKAVLEDVEKKQLNQQHLKDWLEKLQEVVFDAEDVLDTFATDTKVYKRFQTPLSNTAYKHDVANKIKDISRRFDVIYTEKERFHLNSQVDVGKLETANHTVFHVVQSDVVGREADKENIINMMLSNEYDREGDVSVIPIMGMGGLGKTTLAQFVFNDEKIAQHFESRMWICVTVDFNPTRILKEMIQFHSKVKLDESSESHLHSRLLEFLKGQLFLLVLHDVWLEDYNRWDQSLLGLLRNGAKGSIVLVTSRITKVVIGTLPPYNLSYLSEDDCWSLFSRIVCRNGSLPENLERIGITIIGKCKGLPLAVKGMAGILINHTDDVNKWKQIQNNEIWEIEEQESGFERFKIMAILKLSYDHLPYYLKHCFAYCSIFPKAYVFNKKELVKNWIAQAIIESRGRDTLEETGIAHFHELITSMHDLMHDLALSISSPTCCQPMLQIVKNAQKLRSLLFPSVGLKSFSNQVLDNLFRTLKYLRSLDLSSSVILKSKFSDSICNLYNLQTLKLQGCLWLSGLPKNLGTLVNLRHLDLEDMFWFKYSSKLPPRMGNLINLHNLHAFGVGNKNKYRIEELKNMEHLSKTLHISNMENAVNAREAKLNKKKNLDKLTFEWSDRGKGSLTPNTQDEVAERSVLEDLQPHVDLKELQVFRYGGNEFSTWMSEGRLQNLVKVTLDGCIKCKTLTIGVQLPNLKELYIKRMLELEKWPEVDCHSLRRLKFTKCPKLRELPRIFPYLNVMKIKGCNSLRSLPVALSLMFLILADNLMLEDWQEIILMMQSVGNDDQGQCDHHHSFSNLLELKVISCPRLNALPQIFFPQQLEIINSLNACHDGALVRAIPDTNSLYSLVISSVSNLTLIPKCPHLPGLTALYISDIKDLVSLSESEEGSLRTLTSLKLLFIQNCPMLSTINEQLPTTLKCLIIGSCTLLQSLGPKEILKNLCSLKDLYIEDCHRLQSLPEDGLPESLSLLKIQSCPLLAKCLQKKDGVGPDWSKIAYILDLQIDCPEVPTTPILPRKKPIWFHHFVCCKS
ncbi:hypothetical protein I3843_13G132300 [Carya illinoinensis]|nr:hypothetical protein I3843_13G132300 [Carya illinoinensis]